MSGFNYGHPTPVDAIGTSLGPTGGKGLTSEQSQQQVTDLQYDKVWAIEKLNGAHCGALYPTTNGKDLDILEREILFIKKPIGEPKCRPIPVGLTSMNGVGSLAATLFPNDWRMQKEALLNEIKVIGTARDNVKFEKIGNLPGVCAQVAGKDHLLATSEMPLGYSTMIDLPDPKENSRGYVVKNLYASQSKVVLQLTPYLHTSLSSMINTHLCNIFMNKSRYTAAMGKTYRTTDSWLNFAYNTQNLILMSFLEILDTMMSTGILDVNFRNGPFDLRNQGGVYFIPNADPTHQRNLILGIAKAFGLINGASSDLEFVYLDEIKKRQWEVLVRQLMQTVFCAEQVSNLGYGWNRTKQMNDAVDPHTNNIMGSTSVGAFYRQQLQVPREYYNGLSGAIQRQNDRFFGNVTKQAHAGHVFSTTL